MSTNFNGFSDRLKTNLKKYCPVVYNILLYLWRRYKALRNKIRFYIIKENFYLESITSQPEFVEYKNNKAIAPLVKLIAFYLPQFHPFPENDEWWGKGFTEWRNVTRAKPNFKGHYQPHRPIHFGYYDLRVPEVMEEQAKLAKAYGIYGFSYYFYWFNGKVLMEKPLQAMLQNKRVDMPFCLTWANENWTRRWDGNDKEILIAQHYSKEDASAFFQYLVPYFRDERYIRIDGKPVLMVYRVNDIPKIKEVADLWRKEAQAQGFPGLYLIAIKFYNFSSPEEIGFDALVEFPPHKLDWVGINNNLHVENPNFTGCVFNYDETIKKVVFSEKPEYKLFQTTMLSWDNTARRQDSGYIFHNFNIPRYQQWLSYIANAVYKNEKYSKDEKLIFVNAWNEWAEGTHLEPDEKFGYAYLQATYDVLKNYDADTLSKISQSQPKKNSNYAIILHLFFEDLWDEIYEYLCAIEIKFDLYVTVCSSMLGLKVKEKFPDAYIEVVENRGRDILPFIRILPVVASLKYNAVCKIHSKKSTHRSDGSLIRKKIFDTLIGSKDIVTNVIASFENDPCLGMVIPKQKVLTCQEYMGANEHNINVLSTILKLKFQPGIFPAGSMFWFRPEALVSLSNVPDTLFAMEENVIDGKVEHAVERLFCSIVEKQGYSISTC